MAAFAKGGNDQKRSHAAAKAAEAAAPEATEAAPAAPRRIARYILIGR
jgi:hypothetical protein